MTPHPALQILNGMRQAFPELGKELRQCARQVQRKLTLEPHQRDALVLEAIDDGCQTVADIVAETGVEKDLVQESLRTLLAGKIIEQRGQGGKTEQARGAVTKLYFRA